MRYYLMSGLSHGVGDVTTKATCQQFLEPVSPYPAHRALLVALDEWVSDGTQPPKSECRGTPTAAFAVTVPGSQTGVVPQKELGWPDIPGVTYTGVITTRYFLDFGPDFDDGIISNYPPSVAGRPSYPIFVSKVDKDGNEIAGVRLPPVEAPIATTTGWALRAPASAGTTAVSRMASTSPSRRPRPSARPPATRAIARRALQESRRVREGSDEGGPEPREGRLPACRRRAAYIDEAEASNVLR